VLERKPICSPQGLTAVTPTLRILHFKSTDVPVIRQTAPLAEPEQPAGGHRLIYYMLGGEGSPCLALILRKPRPHVLLHYSTSGHASSYSSAFVSAVKMHTIAALAAHTRICSAMCCKLAHQRSISDAYLLCANAGAFMDTIAEVYKGDLAIVPTADDPSQTLLTYSSTIVAKDPSLTKTLFNGVYDDFTTNRIPFLQRWGRDAGAACHAAAQQHANQ